MKKKFKIAPILWTIVVFIVIAISIFPLFYLVIQSLSPEEECNRLLIPTRLTFDNYLYLFGAGGKKAAKWMRGLLNSFLVSTISSILSVGFGLTMGYALGKLHYFKGRKFLVNSILLQMFFPAVILLVPKYLMLKGLVNTYAGMIVPTCLSLWSIFMYYNYFRSLPNEAFEAAKIDGASTFGIMWHIALPTTKAITTIVFLTEFMNRWNTHLWDMIISPSTKFQTLNILVSINMNQLNSQEGVLMAASTLLVVPIILVFLIFSKNFSEGINFMLK